MILKSYEAQKINLKKFKIILFYGKNEGQKKEIVEKLIDKKNCSHYEQSEVLEKENEFLETILSKSLFLLNKEDPGMPTRFLLFIWLTKSAERDVKAIILKLLFKFSLALEM